MLHIDRRRQYTRLNSILRTLRVKNQQKVYFVSLKLWKLAFVLHAFLFIIINLLMKDLIVG